MCVRPNSFQYVTNTPIYVVMCNRTVTTFEWFSRDNSYKVCTASASADSAGILMNVYLAYSNSNYA
ncbi:hypothetical protein Ahos_1771 [Acidianus hospitalis W1]|uniref:Uncharacterized protein n=1 Tax=Acidianus hospitalis (strain W1) TaxID=933801 RepID=F4B6V4_ACIHW|nr:hypothetical protein Ahos_1771 [Acidianus hospitalis W1]